MTRRDWLTLSATLLPAACSSNRRAGFPGYALIATAGDPSLAVVDLATFRLAKTIPLGAPPTAVLPVPHSGHSLILTPSSDSVHLVDQNLSLISSHRLGEGIAEVRLFPDGRSVLAIARHTRELIQANLDKPGVLEQSLTVTRRFKLQAEPVSFDVSQKTGYAAISTGAAGSVEWIHLASGKHVSVPVAKQVGTVRFRGDGQILLVAQPNDSSLTALDVATTQIVAELPLAMRPENLCFTPDQGQLFITGQGMDGVGIVFPYNTLEVEQTILAGRDPGIMAASDSPGYLFVASASGSDISILDIQTRKLVGLVDVAGQPDFIQITPDSRFALVLCKSGDLAVISIPEIKLNRAKTGAKLFTLLGVGSQPVHLGIISKV